MASNKERIADVSGLITALVHRKRNLLSVMQCPDRELEAIEKLRVNAQKMLDEAARRESMLKSAKDQYIEADDRVMELRQELTYLENQAKIDKMQELVEELNGIDPALLQQYLNVKA